MYSRPWRQLVRYFHARGHLSMTFEGNTKGVVGTDEERLKSVFGGRLKGEPPKSTSRFLTSAHSREIAGIIVPSRPVEPDNCCMSGCVNCVWELYNDDLKDWNTKRKRAAHALSGSDEIWPTDFDPPLRDLDVKNVPESLRAKKEALENKKRISTGSLFPKRVEPLPESVIEAKRRNLTKRASKSGETAEASPERADEEGWENVPVFFKAFAEFEKKKKLEKQLKSLKK